jgi:hypothetical protein
MNKKSTRILLLFAAFALFIVPVVALAAAGFDDVDDDNVFVADIQWMKDKAITKGCNPPSNTNFCPEKAVTRQQMAAFMRRLATKKVVDAATAVDSDTLDGKDAADLTRIEGGIGEVEDDISTQRTVLSQSIDAPVAGVIAITGTVWLEDDCSDGVGSFAKIEIFVDGTAATFAGAAMEDCITGADLDETVASTFATEIPAGVTTVDIRVTGSPLVWVGESGLSIVFSPFGSGATLTGASHTRPSQ